MIISLFFVLNPLGNIPVFVSLLASFSGKKQRKIIVREFLIALATLLLFAFFGDEVLRLLGISPSVLGVAGGTLLFLIALPLIFPKGHDPHEPKSAEPMIVPLAIPMVAGPGSIAMVMIFAEQLHNAWLTLSVLVLAWLPTLAIILLSSHIKNFLGQKGLMACQKLGGMVISLIAINMICSGLVELLQQALGK